MSYDVHLATHSVGPNKVQIATFKLRYPRMIHAEFMTHRMFSRNASSTRAIPVEKMIEWVLKDPAMPVYWGKNQKGMQATEELDPAVIAECESEWLFARDEAVERARMLMNMGVHKQIASRILEPWAHINVVVTATSYDNFFSLRCDKNAMPEIQVLAVKMARLLNGSVPLERVWHLPFVSDDELSRVGLSDAVKFSVARCARVSYETFDGKPPVASKDIELHDMLEGNGHWSPFEHQARCETGIYRSGNFLGWEQYRQRLKKSVHEVFDYSKLSEFGDSDFIV